MATKSKEELAELEKLLGVDLKGDAEITFSTGEGQVRELRMRSLGAAAYDIWNATYQVERQPKENLKELGEVLGVSLDELRGDARIDVNTAEGGERSLRLKSLGAAFYDIWAPLHQTEVAKPKKDKR